MMARLGRRPVALGWIVCALGLMSRALAAEPSVDDLAGLAAQLGAADFVVREHAARRLVQAGEAAVEPLKIAILQGNAEASWRAAAALAQIAVDGDDDAFAKSAAALRSVSASGDGVSGIDLNELRNKRIAKRRAKAEASIRALGGLFGLHVDEPSVLLDPQQSVPTPAITAALDEALQKLAVLQPAAPPVLELPPAPAPPPDITPEELATLTQVEPAPPAAAVSVAIADAYVSPELQAETEAERALTLNEAWRGGDEGLADLRHLPDVVSVRLEEAPVSDAALSYISILPRLRDMRVIRSPFTPAALGRFRQRHPNVTVFVNEQTGR